VTSRETPASSRPAVPAHPAPHLHPALRSGPGKAEFDLALPAPLQGGAQAGPVLRMRRPEQVVQPEIGSRCQPHVPAEHGAGPEHARGRFELPGAETHRIGREVETRLTLAQRHLGAVPLVVRTLLGQHAADRDGQAAKAVLHDVVGGAVLHRLDRRFLPERAGDEDERRARRRPPHYGQRLQPVEARQRVVGEDDVVPAAGQRGGEALARVHPLDLRHDPRGGQRLGDQLGVDRAVLEVQDPAGLHARLRVRGGRGSAHGAGGPSRCGGASFSTAQNTPRSRTASRNSL
jgi:hypothetical protein